MKFTYTLTKNDFDKFINFTQKRNIPKSSRKYAFLKDLILWLFIGILIVSLKNYFGIKYSSFHLPTALVVAFPFVIFIFAYF